MLQDEYVIYVYFFYIIWNNAKHEFFMNSSS